MTRDRLNKANSYLSEKRRELEAIISDYRRMPEESHPLEALSFRSRFTDFAAGLTAAIIESQRILMQVEQETKQAFLTNFFAEKEQIGENSKVISDEKAKRIAEFKTAENYILENYAKINHVMAKELKNDAKMYVEEINQRIPVLKDEMFYSRQPNNIKK